MTAAPTRVPAGAPPSRSLVLRLIPFAVAAAMLALLAWCAWPTLRPVPDVSIAQALPVRGAAEPDAATAASSRVPETPSVQAPGWLEADPFPIACTALADGVVATVDVLEGDTVRAGDRIATLVAIDSELRQRRAAADLDAARARLQRAESDLIAAQATWDNPVDRDFAADDARALVASREADVARLPAELDAARARLAELEETHARLESSRARGAATEYEIVIARHRVTAQRAMIATLEADAPRRAAGLDQARAAQRAADRHLVLRIEERQILDRSRAAATLARADVALAEVRLDEATLEHERMTIRAPIDGIVQRRLKMPGDVVRLGMDNPTASQLVHLYDPAHLQVRCDVPLADARHVSIGQTCEVVVEVLPDTTFRGEVTRITHEADVQKNTLQVKVRVLDPSPLLRPEMLTRVRFVGRGGSGRATVAEASRSAAVRIPRRAVDDSTGTPKVWVVRERRGTRGVLHAAPIEILEAHGAWATIRGAVRSGDLLAVEPVRPVTGTAVRIAGVIDLTGGAG